ncbi:hypothetical protein PMAYCL1PPCAC_16697, partial [Pristionchus mayeri]
AHSEVSHDVNSSPSLLSPAIALTEYHSSVLSRHEEIVRMLPDSTSEVLTLIDECLFNGIVTHEHDHRTRGEDCEDRNVLCLKFLEVVVNTMRFELMEISDKRQRSGSWRESPHVLIVLVDVENNEEYDSEQEKHHE